jgi:hypothetical protein
MELIKQYTNSLSFLFQSVENSDFDETFLNIKNDNKVKLGPILKYVDSLLRLTLDTDESEIKTLHINFSINLSYQERDLIAEYLLLKFHIDNVKYKSGDLEGLENEINILTNRVNNFCYPVRRTREYPNGISTIEYNQLVESHKKNKALLKFYKSFNKKLRLKLLFNSSIKQIHSLKNNFEYFPVAIELNDSSYTSNLLNSNKTLNEIDGFNSEIINTLESIILFDCDRKIIMSNFSFEEIKKWNSDYDTSFKNYLIITFGKEYQSINKVRSKIEIIKDKFKIPNTSSYTILESEIDFLLKRKEKSSIPIDFVGFESSSFWETFVLETSIRELYELRSIKLMNVYSICYNEDIKCYIIDNLFSKKESSELISSSTKMAILELSDDDIETLKEALSNTLDLIISTDIKSKIIESLSNTPTIIFDEAIIRNVSLLSKVTHYLGLTRSKKLKTWSDLLNPSSNYFLILSYRDQGKYPNYYYPNLLENEFDSETAINAVLPNFLFGHNYKWSKYYLLKEYHKSLTHPIRENYFEWNKLKNVTQTLKPDQKLNIDWNLENEYSNSEQRETFKIKLKNQRAKTFNSSDLFIISEDNNISRKVVKIDYLVSLESDDNKVYIQNLDEIQENINIYDKIVDKKQQEEELEVIRKQFNLSDETAGRLWKVLLKNIANAKGEENLYNELKSIFESKGVKIVSQFHFKNSWINPLSESIAPLSKRVFIELCDYLKIPKVYFVIIQRIRNASKQSSRQSTRQMNQLLKDLFNDGCFDNGKNASEIINNRLAFYKSNHPLDELGIDENYLAGNLVTLTELIQPELKLQELETIEKLSNE